MLAPPSNKDTFYYTNDYLYHAVDYWHWLGLVDVWRALEPYLTTNRSLLVCPADLGGPANIAWMRAQGDIPQTRRLAEVTHPSQKLVIACCAFYGAQDLVQFMGNQTNWSQGHGPDSFTVLFVDGRAAHLKWTKWLWDPKAEAVGGEKDWASLGWTDFP